MPPVDFEHKIYDFSSVDLLLRGAETIALQVSFGFR